MKGLFDVCALLVFSAVATFAWGQSLQNEPLYPNAKLVDSFNGGRTHHPVIASAMKKVNGIVKADEEQYLDGQLSRKLYLLPDEISHFPAYDLYVKYFLSQGVKELFSCQRFHCGDSNYWANNVFKIPILYGLDREQSYFLGKKVIEGKVVYYSVYTIRRGNRRSYALVDIFSSDKKPDSGSMNNGTLYSQLLKEGYLYLPADNVTNVAEYIGMILSNHTNEVPAVLMVLTTKDISSLEAFDYAQSQANQWMLRFERKLADQSINKRQFRLIYGGTHQGQSTGYQLKILPLTFSPP